MIIDFPYFFFTGKHFKCNHVLYCHKNKIKKVHQNLKLKLEKILTQSSSG